MTSHALASLTATYTDSEGEEDMESGQTASEKSRSPSPNVHSSTDSPKPPAISTNAVSIVLDPAILNSRKRLVSYNEETAISDDEANPIDIKEVNSLQVKTNNSMASNDEVVLPPAPTTKCPPELQEKISVLYNKMVSEGRDMNKVIHERKSFRNPSIYEKLIEFCDINELDSNYPPEIYDPLNWGKESYYDELAKVQVVEMEKRKKERKEKISQNEFNTGLVKRSEPEVQKKRKSKWDQVAPNVSTMNMVMKPAGLVQPALTSATEKKETVLAFGSLQKKPRL